jgi:hypothetical protein
MSLHSLIAQIESAARIEAPAIEAVNMQVRTGLSVPFAPFMSSVSASSGSPDIKPVDFQVRTGLSIPFAPDMIDRGSHEEPAVGAVGFQVRTGLSMPFASYMVQGSDAGPAAKPVDLHVRTGLSVAFNPYMLGAHAEELLKKRIMISPVVVVWQYTVADEAGFKGWLATREILLSESRMAGDPGLKGVRYGGTYRIAGGDDAAARFKTIWGYTSEAAMSTMHRLCSDDCASASLIQLELIDFVRGLKGFIVDGGSDFTQETMISASAGQA